MTLRSIVVWPLATFLLLSCIACSGDDDDAMPSPPLVEQDIGVGGGTVAVPDLSISLEFPPGAVGATTTITVREASRAPAGSLGPAFDFGPNGTQFAEPVILSFDYVAGDLADGTLPHELALLTWNGSTWEEVEGAFVDAGSSAGPGSLIVPLQHFSTYAVARLDGVDTFYGTFGFARDDIYAYGRATAGDGVITRWDGAAVSTVETLPGGRFFDGFGLAPTAHFALAYDGLGRILRSVDGITWIQVASSPEALLAIHGDATLQIAVGYGQTILEDSGTGWVSVTGVPNAPGFSVPRPLHAVVSTGNGAAFAGGDDVLYERSGGAWGLVDLSVLLPGRFTVRGLWARATDDVVAVGWETDPRSVPPRRAIVLRFDGTTWSVERPATAPGDLLNGVWGVSNLNIAVGNSGTVMEGLDLLLRQTTDVNANLYDVWALDDTTVAFVGSQGAFAYPGFGQGSGGGSGTCSGTANVYLDFRASQGATQILTCGAQRVVQGYTMSLGDVLLSQAGENDACVLAQQACVDSQDGSNRGGGDTFLFFEDCARISIDLTSDARAVGCIEIDVVDFCSPEFCDGGVDARTVAFLYDAQDNLIDIQGTLTGGNQTLTLDGSSARAARIDIRFTYGGLEGVRLFY